MTFCKDGTMALPRHAFIFTRTQPTPVMVILLSLLRETFIGDARG